MAMPKVNIILQNGGLQQTAGTDDQVCGLLLMTSATPPAGLALLTPKQIFSTAEAVALGITAAYDTAQTTNCYKQISDFYAQAGEGHELWIMLVVNTTLMATAMDVVSTTMAYALINAANGRIKVMGISRKPNGGYSPTYTAQIDADAINALLKAQALGDFFAGVFKPLRFIIDGRDFQGTLGSLGNLKLNTYNRCAMVIGADTVSTKESMVGRVLGRLAKIPVQRNIARVKDGALGISAAFFTGTVLTTDIKDIAVASLDNVNDLGYIFPRKHQGLSDYYFNDDPTATLVTDDLNTIGRGRVIDKATVIAYQTYVLELADDLDVDASGKLTPAVAKYYQGAIDRALRNAFFGGPYGAEVSNIKVIVDTNQNIVATNKVSVSVFIQPKAYSKTIEVKLGLTAVTG